VMIMVVLLVVVTVVLLSVGFESILTLKVKIIINRWTLILEWSNVLDESDADVVVERFLDLGVGDVSIAIHKHGSVHGASKLIDLLLHSHHLLSLHSLGPIDRNQKGESSDFLNK
jgi:hypothetical protein